VRREEGIGAIGLKKSFKGNTKWLKLALIEHTVSPPPPHAALKIHGTKITMVFFLSVNKRCFCKKVKLFLCKSKGLCYEMNCLVRKPVKIRSVVSV
jgi:hypothetical protein